MLADHALLECRGNPAAAVSVGQPERSSSGKDPNTRGPSSCATLVFFVCSQNKMWSNGKTGLMLPPLQAQNLFSGSIPDMIGLTGLILMDLGGNWLTGRLPEFWAASASLEYFSAQHNMLTGSIPTGAMMFRLYGKHGHSATHLGNMYSSAEQ